MDQLQDLRNLVSDLREINRLQKEKEARDAWTKYVSLSMIIVAVLTTVAGGKGGGFSSGAVRQLDEATYVQSQASDQWSYYQAKAIKQTLAESELAQMKSDFSGEGVGVPPTMKQLAGMDRDAQREAVDKFKERSAHREEEKAAMRALTIRIERYDQEKADIQKKATELEAKRDQCRSDAARLSALGSRMGLASSLFQLSIALGGVCLIMKKRWIWGLSLVLGAAALVRMVAVLYFP